MIYNLLNLAQYMQPQNIKQKSCWYYLPLQFLMYFEKGKGVGWRFDSGNNWLWIDDISLK